MRPGFDCPTARRDDRKPDAHGMAVKLMGVDGPEFLGAERDATTQDFVLVDNPTFFVRNALEYRRFSQVLLKAKGKVPSSVYKLLGLLLGGPARSLATLFLLSLSPGGILPFLRLVRFASKRIASPLTTRYWSSTPYRFGDTCMKFSAVPADFPGGPPAEGPIDDSFEALVDFLRPVVATGTARPHAKENSPCYLREALAPHFSPYVARSSCSRYSFSETSGHHPDRRPHCGMASRCCTFPHGRVDLGTETGVRYTRPNGLRRKPVVHPLARDPRSRAFGRNQSVRKDVYSKLSEAGHRLNGVEQREPEVTDPDPTFLPPRWGDDPSAFWHVLDDELDLIIEKRRHLEELRSENKAHRISLQPRPARADEPK